MTPAAVCFTDSPSGPDTAAFMAAVAARINQFWAQFEIFNLAIDAIVWADDGPDLPPIVSVQTSPGEATDGQLTVMRLRAWMAAEKQSANGRKSDRTPGVVARPFGGPATAVSGAARER